MVGKVTNFNPVIARNIYEKYLHMKMLQYLIIPVDLVVEC